MFRCCTPHQFSFIRSILSFPVLNVRRPFDGVVLTPRSTAHGTPRTNLLCRPLLSSPDLSSPLLSMISSPRLTSISTSPFLLIFRSVGQSGVLRSRGWQVPLPNRDCQTTQAQEAKRSCWPSLKLATLN